MSTDVILLYAVGVFTLMVIGIILTMIEFNNLKEEPSQRKGGGRPNEPTHHAERPVRADIRVVHHNDAA